MTVLRVGIVGYGLAGRSFHAPLVRATPGMAVALVVTRDPVRAEAARRDNPGATVVDRFEELVADASDVDLVVIASPSGLHAGQAKAVLEAGKHVVVDKPVAATAEEFRSVMAVAARAGVQLHAFQNRRYDSDFLTLGALLQSGRLGTIHRFESRLERWRPGGNGGWREAGSSAELGGLLYDLGPHVIDQALVTFGPVSSVWARVRAVGGGQVVDDDVVVVLQHRDGVTSVLSTTLFSALPGPRFRVLGSTGAAVFAAADTQADRLRAGDFPDLGALDWGYESGLEAVVATGPDPAVERVPYLRGCWPAYYAGVRDAILVGADMPVRPESALATAEIIDAVRESSTGGRVVVLS